MTDESGAVSVDWVVLSAVLVGTGLSVLSTVRGGVSVASVDVAEQLRGQVVQRSFSSDRCQGGVGRVQAQETARAAAAGRDAIRVSSWLEVNAAGQSDAAIVEELDRLRAAVGDGGGLSMDETLLAALECEAVIRGLD
ncbi:MAG: hypothetical protein AAGF30_02295 [Pseudomonadota bacterium]